MGSNFEVNVTVAIGVRGEWAQRMPTPEELARRTIDAALEAAGWCVQDASGANLYAGRGVALREFPLKAGHGFADYLLFVDAQAVGAIEAKPEGMTLTGV